MPSGSGTPLGSDDGVFKKPAEPAAPKAAAPATAATPDDGQQGATAASQQGAPQAAAEASNNTAASEETAAALKRQEFLRLVFKDAKEYASWREERYRNDPDTESNRDETDDVKWMWEE